MTTTGRGSARRRRRRGGPRPSAESARQNGAGSAQRSSTCAQLVRPPRPRVADDVDRVRRDALVLGPLEQEARDRLVEGLVRRRRAGGRRSGRCVRGRSPRRSRRPSPSRPSSPQPIRSARFACGCRCRASARSSGPVPPARTAAASTSATGVPSSANAPSRVRASAAEARHTTVVVARVPLEELALDGAQACCVPVDGEQHGAAHGSGCYWRAAPRSPFRPEYGGLRDATHRDGGVRIATGVALLHALDDAFLNRQPGVDIGQHALAAIISLVAGIAAILAFPRLRPGIRAATSLTFGVLAIVNSELSMESTSPSTAHPRATTRASSHSPQVCCSSASDWQSRSCIVARALDTGTPLDVPARCRRRGRAPHLCPRPPDERGHRHDAQVPRADRRAAAAVSTSRSHSPPRTASSSRAGTAGPAIARLSSWCTVAEVTGPEPSRTPTSSRATGTASSSTPRGRGESEGTPVSFGWGWPKDVAGALAFLRDRAEIDRTGSAGSASRPAPTS